MIKTKGKLFLGVLLLLISVVTHASNVGEILDYLGNGNEEEGLKQLEYLVDKENSTAILVLSDMINDIGVKTNNSEAIMMSMVLLQKSAELGNSKAMKDIALSYYQGRNVEQNYTTARTWFEKSAKLGNVNSMVYLGLIYQMGDGVEVNLAKSLMWYEIADYAYKNTRTTGKTANDIEPTHFASDLVKKTEITGYEIESGINLAKDWINNSLNLNHKDPGMPRIKNLGK